MLGFLGCGNGLSWLQEVSLERRVLFSSMEEGAMSPSYSSMSADLQETSDTEEFMMQQNQLFLDSLKGLKKIRSQLYSAAEYFEVSYGNDDKKQIVMNTLRDYTIKALVNAVDHLGSVSHKVNGFISQEVDEIDDAELRTCYIEQRLRTCQECIDAEGRSQQALVIKGPRHHKHYMLKGGSVPESGLPMNYQEYVPCKDENRPKQIPNVKGLSSRGRTFTSRIVRSAAPSRSSSPQLQRAHSFSPSHEAQSTLPFPQPVPLSLKEKRAISPLRTSKSLSRAESPTSRISKPLSQDGSSTPRIAKPLSRAGSPNPRTSKPVTRTGSPPFRPTIPKPSKFPPQRQNSATGLDGKMYNQTRSDQNPTKSRGFLKALLTRRRSRNDELLYSYLDEY